MSGITWTRENLPLLGRVFLRNVLENMRGRDDSEVQFGETGDGVMPNYQVKFPNGVVRTLRGSSHEAFEQAEPFAVRNISEPFKLAEVTEAYMRAGRGG